MRRPSLCVLVLALACSSSTDDPGGNPGASGTSPVGSGGTNATSGAGRANGGATSSSAGRQAEGGDAGELAASGAANGSAGRTSVAGSTSGGATSGAGGTASSGRGGAGGHAGGAGRAGAGGANVGGAGMSGAGGAGACVKNLACKLSPPPTSGDLYQDCVDRINQFLTQCACLPALTRRKDGEACADQMAKYDADQNTAHAGTTANICQPRGSQNECPGYSSNNQVIGLCMQQMWDEGPPPTAECTGACYEEHGHFINMTDAKVSKVSCGFYTTAAGKVWAVQNFFR